MNYREYHFSKSDLIKNIAAGVMIDAMIAWTFYRSIVAFIVFLPLVWFYLRYRKETLKAARKDELALEFKETLLSVQSALNAGYSVENAFAEGLKDMELLYGNDAMIVKELKIMMRRLRTNERIEKILLELGTRSGIADIVEFAQIFAAAKRSGGNMSGIIRRAASMISDRMEVAREISVQISAKRYESRIMEIVPFGIIVYITLTSPNVAAIIYHNVLGVILMTVCLCIYAIALVISEKIVSIEV